MTKLKISRHAYERIRAFTELCPDEISGLGKIEVDKDENLLVTDVAIFDQEVSGAHSTIETAALAKFQVDMMARGESLKQWVLWWHSHAHMDTFFSGTDTNTIESSREFPYLVSLVVNKAGKSEARLDVFNPIHIYLGLEVVVEDSITSEVKDICQKEIDQKVKKKREYLPKGSQKSVYPHGTHRPYWEDEDYPGAGFKTIKKSLPNTEEMTDSELSAWLRGDETDFEKTEYWGHKGFLIAAIKKLAKSRKEKDKIRVDTLMEELKEHIAWGRSAGLEKEKPTSDSETSSTQDDSPMPVS